MASKPNVNEANLNLAVSEISEVDKVVSDQKVSTNKKKLKHEFNHEKLCEGSENPAIDDRRHSVDADKICCLTVFPGLRSVGSPRKKKSGFIRPATCHQHKSDDQSPINFACSSHDTIVSDIENPNVPIPELPKQDEKKAEDRQQQDRSGSTVKQKLISMKNDDQMSKLIGLLATYKVASPVIKDKIKPRLSDSDQLIASLAGRQSTALFRSGTHLPTYGASQPRGLQYYLEDSWRNFVMLPPKPSKDIQNTSQKNGKVTNNHNSCGRYSETEQITPNLEAQQEAIWELLSTEVFYIKRLQVIIDLFQKTLTNLQQNSLLDEVDSKLLFGNIKEVYEANCRFWSNHLLAMLTKARATGNPMDIQMLSGAINGIRCIFAPYCEYCLDQSKCFAYVKNLKETNEYFKIYVDWCESQKECERLRLSDLLAEPIQRLTKYSLLLKAIADKSDEPDELYCLKRMIVSMKNFVSEVNLRMRSRDEIDRLSSIASKIESYDYKSIYNEEVEQYAKNYHQLDLIKPIYGCRYGCKRQLLFNSQQSERNLNLGQLRFQDPLTNGKTDIILLIFTDQLLICKLSNQTNKWVGRQKSLNASNSNSTCSATANTRPIFEETQRRAASSSKVDSMVDGDNPSRLDGKLFVPNSPFASNRSLLCRSIGNTTDGPSTHKYSPTSDQRQKLRKEFTRSRDSSGDNQLDTDSAHQELKSSDSKRRRDRGKRDQTNCSQLRVIRPPYPVARLAMHEFIDGMGLFCCQLNDDQTLCNTFCIYFRPHAYHAGTGVGCNDQEFNVSNDHCTRDNPDSLYPLFPRHKNSKPKSPAKQLMAVIYQAQAMVHSAAEFHRADIFKTVDEFSRSWNDDACASSNDVIRHSQSLYRMSARKNRAQLVLDGMGEQNCCGEKSQSRSVSCESHSTNDITLHCRNESLAKILEQQLILMQISHGETRRSATVEHSMNMDVSRSKQIDQRHVRSKATKASSSPCGSSRESFDQQAMNLYKLSNEETYASVCFDPTLKADLYAGGLDERKMAAQHSHLAISADSDNVNLSTDDDGFTVKSEDSTVIGGESSQFSELEVIRDKSPLMRKLANPSVNSMAQARNQNKGRKQLNRQDMNVSSIDPSDWQLHPSHFYRTAMHDDSKSLAMYNTCDYNFADGQSSRLFLKRYRDFTISAELSLASADRTTSTVSESSDLQQSEIMTRLKTDSYPIARSDHQVDMKNFQKSRSQMSNKNDMHLYKSLQEKVDSSQLFPESLRANSLILTPRSPPAVTLTKPDHKHPSQGSLVETDSELVYLNLPEKLHRQQQTYDSTNVPTETISSLTPLATNSLLTEHSTDTENNGPSRRTKFLPTVEKNPFNQHYQAEKDHISIIECTEESSEEVEIVSTNTKSHNILNKTIELPTSEECNDTKISYGVVGEKCKKRKFKFWRNFVSGTGYDFLKKFNRQKNREVGYRRNSFHESGTGHESCTASTDGPLDHRLLEPKKLEPGIVNEDSRTIDSARGDHSETERITPIYQGFYEKIHLYQNGNR